MSRFRFVLGLCLGSVVGLAIFLPSAAAKGNPAQEPRRPDTEVLVLSSEDPDLPDVAAMIEQTETRILNGSDRPVHFSFEYLDFSTSFADASRKQATASYLLRKYQGQTLDLVIAINEDTVMFAEQIRPKLFPDAALLFFVTDPENPSRWTTPEPGTTGVVRTLDYLSTLQLALRQNPGTAHVIVVSGSSDGEKRAAQTARDQLREYETNLDFQYLGDLGFSELGPRLAKLPAKSVILFLDFVTDSRGEQLIPARILPAISKTANCPIYGTFSSLVGAGVVGGSVADLAQVGRVLGNDGVHILKGEVPEKIPVITGDFQHYVMDWRELHRWKISATELPKEGEVRYFQPSPWEIYRWRILGLAGVLLLETALIILLLRNIARRKRTQEMLLRKEEDLAEAQGLARVGNWLWDPKKKVLTCSKELYHIHGLDPSLPLPPYETWGQFFAPGGWERFNAVMEEALRSGSIREVDVELIRPDGSHRWLTVRGMGVRDESNRASYLRGTTQDITERRQAEEARSRLAAIVESSDDAIISKNLEGIILSWNRGAENLFGFSEAEAVGQTITSIIPPENPEEEETILAKIRAGGKVEHSETVRVTKEGKKIDVSLTISPMRDATGKVVGASKVARDISERKRAEAELRKSEERFSKAFRQSPMALSLVSARTHCYLDISETFERTWGYTRDDVKGRTAVELGLWVHPEERARLTRKMEAEGSLRGAECEWRTRDGRILIAWASVEMVEIGGERCFLGVSVDITDRKRAEQAVLESEQRFRLMANTAPVMIWTSGTDKLCDYFNQPWLDFTGRPLAAELGNGWAEGVHPEDLQGCLDTYTQAFNARQPFEMQYRLRRHDGEYRWILDKGVARFSGDKMFEGYIGSCLDITERKIAEEALSTVGQRLMEAQEAERSRVARELHDDINQRLALLANRIQECDQATSASTDTLQKKELGEIWRLTNEISTDIQQMSHQLHPSKLHYLGLAATVRDLCREFSRLHKIRVEFVVGDLPLSLDENVSLSLFRVVQESLRNAVKHSQARQVKVELTGQPGVIRLRISDDGNGFDPEHERGTHGLGLISMRERLRAVGGEFSICSKPKVGTQVEGSVPVPTKPVRGGEDSRNGNEQNQPLPNVSSDSSRAG
ncbi:MAG: PAS domain S-box protein [Terriglobales bacterium]|jgi:PAS domain S-box-containing protein